MSKKSSARLTGYTERNVPVHRFPFDTAEHRNGRPFKFDFKTPPISEWGDHPQTFIGPVRDDNTQPYLEFRFKDSTKKELCRELACLRRTDEAARAAFIDDLEWAMVGYCASELVKKRAKSERDRDRSLMKELHKCLSALLVPLREAISPERRFPLPAIGPKGLQVPLDSEFVKGVIERLEELHQSFARVFEAEARRKRALPKNRGGRPREFTRRDIIERAAKNYNTRFGKWPLKSRKSPFLNVLNIALTAAGSPNGDLYKELRGVLRELKDSSAAS